MSVPEKYIDALYAELRAKDIRLTWTELEDSLKAVENHCVHCGEAPGECVCDEADDDECGDWPAPCNCIDPTTHDRSLE